MSPRKQATLLLCKHIVTLRIYLRDIANEVKKRLEERDAAEASLASLLRPIEDPEARKTRPVGIWEEPAPSLNAKHAVAAKPNQTALATQAAVFASTSDTGVPKKGKGDRRQPMKSMLAGNKQLITTDAAILMRRPSTQTTGSAATFSNGRPFSRQSNCTDGSISTGSTIIRFRRPSDVSSINLEIIAEKRRLSIRPQESDSAARLGLDPDHDDVTVKEWSTGNIDASDDEGAEEEYSHHTRVVNGK